MTAALCVPIPRDDQGSLSAAVSLAAQLAEEFASQQSTLTGAGITDVGWAGSAAAAFAGQHEVGRARVKAVAHGHAQLHRQLATYHNGLVAARGRCTAGHRAVGSALDEYATRAGEAAGMLLGGLETVISKLWHLITHPWEIVEYGIDVLRGHHDKATGYHAKVGGWRPPATRPYLQPATVGLALPGPDVTQPAVVTGLLRSVGGFLVSEVVDGIEELFPWADGLLERGMQLIQDAEDGVARGIAAGQRLAHEAFDDLNTLARRVVSDIESGAMDYLRLEWTIGKDLFDVAGALSSVGLLIIEKDLGVSEGPRLSQKELDDLSREAVQRYQVDASYQQQVKNGFLMAQGAYHDNGIPVDKDGKPIDISPWKPIKEISGPDGGFAVLYEDPGPPPHYVLAFRGTQPGTVQDDAEDAENAAGLPTQQGAWAVELAKKYGRAPYNASFTGHSLGGSLAATASLATGNPATTFNAAGVGDGNYLIAKHANGGKVSETQIVNYHTPGDAITDGQKLAGLRPASGGQVTVTGNVFGLGNTLEFKTHSTSDFNLDGPVKAG